MKPVLFLLALCLTKITYAEANQASSLESASKDAPSRSWSLVYLPDLIWTDTEEAQTLDLLGKLDPDLVVSMSPCPFAEKIRSLEGKPMVLDQTSRATMGDKCGIQSIPHGGYDDTSTLHPFGDSKEGKPSLVWISSIESKSPFIGPRKDLEEHRSLARMQIRHQFANRTGEVVFLVDPTVPMPDVRQWILPRHGVKYDQLESAVTGFACICPETLQTEVLAIDGFTSRVPLVHWLYSGPNGMEWNALPTDGGPAIQHASYASSAIPGDRYSAKIHWLNAPSAMSPVPLWMDDYVNHNPALETGNTIPRGAMKRRYEWKDYGVTRDPFHVLHAAENPAPAAPGERAELPRGAVRSPGNLFSVTVGQLSDKGWYPVDGDDGINVYLDDRRTNQSHLLYFQGLYGAWPSAATWFTDRYVITSGTGSSAYERDDEEAYHISTKSPQTLHLFDLQTGRAFTTTSLTEGNGPMNAPTERIFIPDHGNYEQQRRWGILWHAVEAGYQIKPQPAPIPAGEVASLAKFPSDSGLVWQDLGTWPAPETWQLVPEKEKLDTGQTEEKRYDGGDPFLSYTETSDGQRRYRIAVSGFRDVLYNDTRAIADIVAHADLFSTGTGYLRRLETIRRMGDQDRYLILAGTYPKADACEGRWMLLIDLLQWRAWSSQG